MHAELVAIAERLGLTLEYPQFEQVRQLVAHPCIDDPRLRYLLHLPFVTIDNDDSRDLDQALAYPFESPHLTMEPTGTHRRGS
ncbi:MAG: hypothetical protein HN348_16070 [Proteobacteria bacterium]|jgi:hypothetical protein|nr:hypothetical protein [Pseudomonadota bacterium]